MISIRQVHTVLPIHLCPEVSFPDPLRIHKLPNELASLPLCLVKWEVWIILLAFGTQAQGALRAHTTSRNPERLAGGEGRWWAWEHTSGFGQFTLGYIEVLWSNFPPFFLIFLGCERCLLPKSPLHIFSFSWLDTSLILSLATAENSRRKSIGRRETGITSAAAVFWLNQRVSFVFETSRFLFDKSSGSNTHAGVPHLPKWSTGHVVTGSKEERQKRM